MDRREVLKLGAGSSTALLWARGELLGCEARAETAMNPPRLPLPGGTSFFEDTAIEEARLFSRTPYRPAEDTDPKSYTDLNYDRYRAIRFKRDLALWSGDRLGFATEFFSAGYIFQAPVRIFLVEDGRAAEMRYNPDLFTYDPKVRRPPENSAPGFSGLRIHAPVDRPDVMDEFAVFQGANYFRAKAAGQGMECRHKDSQSTPRISQRMNFRFSGVLGLSSPRRGPLL